MAQPAQRGNAAENSLLLSFRVGRDRYAIAVSWIREVLVPGLRIAVPRAPSAVWGVDTHHGRAYAVIDLRTFFNVPGQVAPAVAADQRIIALESASNRPVIWATGQYLARLGAPSVYRQPRLG